MKLKNLTTFAILYLVLVSLIALPRIQPASSPNVSPEVNSEDLQPIASQPVSPSPSPSASVRPNIEGGDSPPSDANKNRDFSVDNLFNSALFDESLPLGPVGSAQTINSTVWRAVAQNAWRYFQPGIGVDSTTGLPGAGIGFPYFTDWDLGVYIQAVLDALTIGIIGKDGEWGADARIEKIMSFLENRPLADGNLPFWWYESGTGNKWDSGTWFGETAINVADTGRLLASLHNLKRYNSLADRIDRVVHERMDYSPMWSNITMLTDTADVYHYLVAKGFASFWPSNFSHVPLAILDNIFAAPEVEKHGVKLPLSRITCEPLLISIFDLEYDSRIRQLGKIVYSASEARYNATGRYTAFSEGNTGRGFVYEWVVLPDGRTWTVQNPDGSDTDINPIIYYKVAFSFLSIYKTEYARKMVTHLENSVQVTAYGYSDGIDDAPEGEGRLVPIVGSNNNGLILSAARYAVQNQP